MDHLIRFHPETEVLEDSDYKIWMEQPSAISSQLSAKQKETSYLAEC